MMAEQTEIQRQFDVENTHTSGAYPKRPLQLVRGEGCTVWDNEGNQYFDATSGQGVAVLGHSHPNIVSTITQQAQTLITCPEIFYNDQRSALYEELTQILPDGINRFFLCNSGAEAIEGALKAARLLTNRTGIVATRRGFHGRTLGALSLTWNKKYREPFAEWQPNATHISYDDLDTAREAITEDTAAIVVEAVQGEGGVHPASDGYLQGLREICDATGTLLIVDEIQTGFGRTGAWFAFQHHGITPDIVAMGKGIGGGLPMGAVAWRGELGTLPRGSHGSTFGGNPLASATATTSIRTLRDDNIIDNAREQGDYLRQRLSELNHSTIRDIRGQGLIIGIQLRSRVTPILQALQAHGVLALPAGANVLRLLPPLIITREQCDMLIQTIDQVLSENT